jgi:hypothetical protein
MERRKQPRIMLDVLSVDINDGKGFFQGRVTDISKTGLCMDELPKRINAETKKLTVVVSGRRDHFRLVVCPKWYINGNAIKTIGGEILTSSWTWEDFVSRLEPLSIDFDFMETFT